MSAVKEFYDELNMDYEGVFQRLGSDAVVQKFVIRFLEDPNFEKLKTGMENKDAQEAFRAAHTIKGICLNLGFDPLYQSSADLTEKLRNGQIDGSGELFRKVETDYLELTQTIRNTLMEK